ncbi:8-amino-7-oxononanoate synthase [Sulfurirhabdus autotrophica]|uniref:8-amino-7-oxononanoate synthase n=1 Tax=Sulfurirhabdus autotrophica TaxID=1706046 RepID=A0A4R3Y014_9PROT|nr:8-amino-7-oxononanoate synthase [Sulfurirhabdus autotrophica]TCV84767.1 8-amino-7-oxononanoate synthase [Sulfurirhabdus autotrophica]
MPFSYLNDDLLTLEEQGLFRRRRIVESAQGAVIRVDGRDYLSFCSNDYLGLANHPALIDAACRGAAQYGVGSGASHLITGHSEAHHKLELALAELVGFPDALLFSTGYMANMGVVSALLSRNDVVFADKLNHASLNDAVLVSRATMQRYSHLDLVQLEKQLIASKHRRKLVVTDAVFSMDGDIAPVPELLKLCERYDAWLLLDDAHGFGVLGREGKGVLEYFATQSPRIIYMATLGKAAGVFGAYVAGSPELIQMLIQRARTYIYTTAFPPMLANALLASVHLIQEEGWRRQRLQDLAGYLKDHLKLARWKLMPSITPIQPIVIGSNKETLAVSAALMEKGILVPAIRPPTVPKGEARLRISFSAAHSLEDARKLVEALNELEKVI